MKADNGHSEELEVCSRSQKSGNEMYAAYVLVQVRPNANLKKRCGRGARDAWTHSRSPTTTELTINITTIILHLQLTTNGQPTCMSDAKRSGPAGNRTRKTVWID